MQRTKVSEWLLSLGHDNVSDIEVTIRNEKYIGARYTSKHHGDYEFLYLLGTLPKCYIRQRKTVFRFDYDSRDWYVACYWQQDQLSRFHPFGKTFMISPWSVPDRTRIDQYERYTYTRVPATILEV